MFDQKLVNRIRRHHNRSFVHSRSRKDTCLFMEHRDSTLSTTGAFEVILACLEMQDPSRSHAQAQTGANRAGVMFAEQQLQYRRRVFYDFFFSHRVYFCRRYEVGMTNENCSHTILVLQSTRLFHKSSCVSARESSKYTNVFRSSTSRLKGLRHIAGPIEPWLEQQWPS